MEININRELLHDDPNVIVVVSPLGIGEETKGATVEWLTDYLHAHTVIRSGGCQSGHHLVRSDGREQMLSHFGSGVFDGATTFLKHMVINPVDLYTEAEELELLGVENPLQKIIIADDCITITPFHGALSRLHEISRGKNKKGTIGMGVGEAIYESHNIPDISIRARDFLGDQQLLLAKVQKIRELKVLEAYKLFTTYPFLQSDTQALHELAILENESLTETVVQSYVLLAKLVKIVNDSYIDELISQSGAIVCEPSHGALLHPRYGFVPHVTQIDPTTQNVMETISQHPHDKKVIRLGVSRSYMTRHGAGPLVSYSRIMTDVIKETHNAAGSWWLGEFRNGYYDRVATDYALQISGGIDTFSGLVLSFMDKVRQFTTWPVVETYTYMGEIPADIDDYFELKDGKITRIIKHPDDGTDRHLDHQRRLTELLKNCKPEVKILKPENGKPLDEVFIKYVENTFHIPVVAVSYGPTKEDRKTRPSWRKLFEI